MTDPDQSTTSDQPDTSDQPVASDPPTTSNQPVTSDQPTTSDQTVTSDQPTSNQPSAILTVTLPIVDHRAVGRERKEGSQIPERLSNILMWKAISAATRTRAPSYSVLAERLAANLPSD